MDFQIKNLYSKWQKDPIDSLTYGSITRGRAIYHFIHEGILPLLYKYGYRLSKNYIQFEDILASMMFQYSINKTKIFTVSDENLGSDMYSHYDYYCNTITHNIWNHFWCQWDDDLNDMFYYKETDLCAQIECVIWECIDLKNSSTYLKYLEETCESEDETPLKREDPYIIDNYS